MEIDAENSVWFKPMREIKIFVLSLPLMEIHLREMHFHYNVGEHKGGIMCPKRNFGERCPICDFASSVWKDGVNNNDEESKKLAKSLFVRGNAIFHQSLFVAEKKRELRCMAMERKLTNFFLAIFLIQNMAILLIVWKGTLISH